MTGLGRSGEWVVRIWRRGLTAKEEENNLGQTLSGGDELPQGFFLKEKNISLGEKLRVRASYSPSRSRAGSLLLLSHSVNSS